MSGSRLKLNELGQDRWGSVGSRDQLTLGKVGFCINGSSHLRQFEWVCLDKLNASAKISISLGSSDVEIC